MNIHVHTRGMAASTCHKAEMYSQNVASLTDHRLYLIPITKKDLKSFDHYEFDFAVTGANPNFDYKVAIYEQVNSIGSSSTTAQLVANTSVTVNGATAAFTTVAAGTLTTLLPASYWIGFIWDENGTTDIRSNNAFRNVGWEEQRWVHHDPGSFTLPSTIAGTSLAYTCAAGEYPIWGAIVYTGDQLP